MTENIGYITEYFGHYIMVWEIEDQCPKTGNLTGKAIFVFFDFTVYGLDHVPTISSLYA